MKHQKYLLIAISGIAIGIIITLVGRYFIVKNKTQDEFIPKFDVTDIEPPQKALKPELKVLSGTVKIFRRNAQDFETFDQDQTVFQGETVFAENGKATLNAPDIFTIDLGDESELTLNQLVFPSLTVSQREGSVTYEFGHSEYELAVRVGNAVFRTQQSLFTLNREGNEVNIIISSGIVDAAIIDDNNQTKVLSLKEGQTANISLDLAEIEVF